MSRLFALLAGWELLVLAQSPWFERWADRDFSGHMAQHLLLGMVAPLLIVLGGPVSLLLRTLPHRHARRLGRLLRRRGVQLLARPWPGLLLASGGTVALYLTPLYELSTRSDAVHVLVHLHLVASGLLFCWAIAGPDPAPRSSVRVRLVALGAAVLVHAVVAQLLYAGLLVDVDEPAAQLQAAGSLMYFGGDLAELALALVLLMTWRPARPRGRSRGALLGA